MYLTKSRFKIGMSCPTKLYYESSDKYENNDDGNEFMKALAKGGLQVGEMAKIFYPGGIEINGKNKEEQLVQTNSALLQENVIIYEAAIKVGHKFIRVDVLEKQGNTIWIIEVKSKSCDGKEESQFFNKSNQIDSGQRPYLEDIAFQYMLALEYFKGFNVIPCLMMPDKQIESSIDGMYENFVISQIGDRDTCKTVEGVTASHLGEKLLSTVNVKSTIECLLNDDYYREHPDYEGKSFNQIIDWFESLLIRYENGELAYLSEPHKKCKECQFHSDDNAKSGFYNCFKTKMNWSDSDFDKPLLYEVWDYSDSKKRIDEGKWFMEEISELDIEIKDPKDTDKGMSRTQRQVLQIENTNNKSKEAHIDIEGLRSEIEEFDWPLNLIDFETTAPAIPFFKGYKPYQGLCFQFSHHILHKDGRVEHKDEYLGMGQGTNPSFKFIERLYESLSKNEGSVFMYSFHENTYLNYMIQLLWKESPFDESYTDKLLDFLKSLTKPSDKITTKWEIGSRKMIDMAVMVRSYYWHPIMKGSNSIKQVLPAIMNDSDFIKEKYSQPIYGKNCEVKSLNFDDKLWVEFDNDMVKDPYKSLPTLDELLPMDMHTIDRLYSNNKVGDGGAAMTSWAFMQFAEMKEQERNNIGKALKMYCELDTMAMVMIMEAWRDMITQ